MKKSIVAAILAVVPCTALLAQSAEDPVVMTINGQPVLRSEFEYSYNKNNSEGVIDKKSVEEYVDLFVNFKLKVADAKSAQLDTLSSFKREFAQYRDQQVRPTIVTAEDIEAEARMVYDRTKEQIGTDGLIQAAHILIRIPQQATEEQKRAAKVRIDSIYQALQAGADFAELATAVSQDPGSAPKGGLLPFAHRGQFFKEFEDVLFAMKDGELSKPVESPAGWHIIQCREHKEFEPFEFHHDNIVRYIEQRGARDRIAVQRVKAIADASDGRLTPADVMQQRADSLAEIDPDMRNLIREYYEGLLFYEISSRKVWEKATKDEAGLAACFAQNKGKYDWKEGPRFKGIAYHVKVQSDVKAVKNCVKKLPFKDWNEALRQTFNPDSVIRIRVQKGVFKLGDNALVDREVFKKDTTVTPVKDYPIDAVYGKLLKKGPEDFTDVRGEVTADYQDQLEREWVAELRRKYKFEVYQDVLQTVNKH